MKSFKAVLILVLFCSLSLNLRAEKTFEFTNTCQKAYNDIVALKLNSGKTLIAQARQENPENLIPDFLDSYIDFFVLFFNEDPKEYKLRKSNFDKRLALFAEGPETSPFQRYCRAIVTLHKATVAIKFSERWTAGWEFRRAHILIKENRQRFPDFAPNDMVYGPMEVGIGTIPSGYKWLAGVFGLKGGGVKSGMQRMRNFLNSKDDIAQLFEAEARFYYCYLMFYVENKPAEVLDYIAKEKLDVVNNHLYAYVAANLGINNKRNEYAKNVILNRNQSSQYLPTSVWDFELAYVKMRHLELSEATKYFEHFLQTFKGRFYVKDACQKLSWCYYLQGNYAAAEKMRQQLLKRGSTDADADKNANKEAKTGTWPNTLLLKARLYSDGGYNKEALLLLQGKNVNDFDKIEDQLEFSYRLARIYDDMDKDNEAINAYIYTIKLGEKRTEYYAARAAVQIGMIYEKQGNKSLAITYYQKCLNMGDHEYKDSLDQRAKAGIARCKGL